MNGSISMLNFIDYNTKNKIMDINERMMKSTQNMQQFKAELDKKG